MNENYSWYSMDIEEVLSFLESNRETGLSQVDASDRIVRFGANKLTQNNKLRMIKIIFSQLSGPLSLTLILAGVATLFLKEFLDTIVIALAVLVNTVIGAYQEGKASRVFDELSETHGVSAIVLRDGKKKVIPSEDLVPGDIVLLVGGKSVPADMRLIESENLTVNESALTGEWVAVAKSSNKCKEGVPMSDKYNMLWGGTVVSEGFGTGVVVATGRNTEMGTITTDSKNIQDQTTPLQKSIYKLSRFLMLVIGLAILTIIFVGVFRGVSLMDMLLLAIAVAVAAMPEGLPAAVTVVLASGMEAVLRKGGLVKSLLAAETLGSTTVILTDKTGTLTEGKMKINAMYTSRSILSKNTDFSHEDNLELLKFAVLASDAFVETKPNGAIVHGRPIEQAIMSAGIENGLIQENMFEHGNARVDFLQFESKRRFSASMNNNKDGRIIYFSGAPEVLLSLSDKVFVAGTSRYLDDETRERFQKIQKRESATGNRFTSVAYMKDNGASIGKDVYNGNPKGLVFVGMMSFSDSVRDDVAEQIQTVKNAGVRIIMLTGDYPETAISIARKVGIADIDSHVVTGDELKNIKESELVYKLRHNSVFARVLPNQKLRIARALKNCGEVVAMTGDGVNDAPALISADIGVAVGSGTDVAKEASDLILLNNTFSTIIVAIREGRRAIDNLRKIVSYLLATSFSEIIVIGGALATGLPIPILPAQILWANIVEEGFMSFPFAFEPADKDIMRRSHLRREGKGDSQLVLTNNIKRIMFVVTIITGALLLALYFWLRSTGLLMEEIRTVMFVALSVDSIFFAISFKDLKKPLWEIPLTNNKILFVALGGSVTLLFVALVVPPIRTLLSLTVLSGMEILLLIGLGITNLFTIEIVKYFMYKDTKQYLRSN